MLQQALGDFTAEPVQAGGVGVDIGHTHVQIGDALDIALQEFARMLRSPLQDHAAEAFGGRQQAQGTVVGGFVQLYARRCDQERQQFDGFVFP